MKCNSKQFRYPLTALFLLAASAMFSTAYAASCGTAGAGLDTADVTFRSGEADKCVGTIAGNNSNIDINTIGLGTGWSAELKDQETGSNTVSFLGLTFSLDGFEKDTDGTWTLTVSDPGTVSLPVTIDIMAVLKAGDQFAAYLFKGELFEVEGDNEGTWKIAFTFTNPAGKDIFQDLSHLSLYFRESAVPVPAAVWLFGSGLLGLIGASRRKKAGIQV